jgi:ribosomal protein L24E
MAVKYFCDFCDREAHDGLRSVELSNGEEYRVCDFKCQEAVKDRYDPPYSSYINLSDFFDSGRLEIRHTGSRYEAGLTFGEGDSAQFLERSESQNINTAISDLVDLWISWKLHKRNEK